MTSVDFIKFMFSNIEKKDREWFDMIYQFMSKNLLFIEPFLSYQSLIYKANQQGYQTFVISENDQYLRLSKDHFMSSSVFFQIDTQNEEAVLSLVKQISEKFNIDGIIPQYEFYGSLSAKIATYLKKPGLRSEISFETHPKDFLNIECRKKNESYLPTKEPVLTSTYKPSTQYETLIKNKIYDQEYDVEGLIKNRTLYIISFTEKLKSPEQDKIELGYIVRSEIEPMYFKTIEYYLQKYIDDFKLDYGFFCAKIKISAIGPVLLDFKMNIAKYIISKLINYATGIDYYDNVLKFFSNQPLTFYRTKNLNVGIIFFYNNLAKEYGVNFFFKTILKNKFIVELKKYFKDDQHLQISPAKTKIGHAILIHQDYNILNYHMKKIAKIHDFYFIIILYFF